MAQVVARLDDDLAAEVDALVASGAVASRSEAIRIGLERLVDEHRRHQIGEAIVAGYVASPQTSGEVGWAEAKDKRRPVLVVTRSEAVPALTWVVIAPVTRTMRHIPTEIALGPPQGLPEACAA